jgi:dTDP-4-dehydrorhamnose reductase
MDLLDRAAIGDKVRAERPDVIVNAAAYTAVDRAEQEPEAAYAVNSRAVQELAAQARAVDALLLHFSTDYVFDGEKPVPYVETDRPRPLGVYGRSKLEGERAVAASGCRHFIFRTSWVYAPGGRNFVNAILAAAKAKPELRVVNDQRGAPTSAGMIARAVTRILENPAMAKQPSGIYHMTAAGATTWYEFAGEILRHAGLVVPLVPVSTAAYGAPAPRPKNSLLDNAKLKETFGVALEDWRDGFRAAMRAMH